MQVGKNTYYIECPAKIGLYRTSEKEVILIDSGNDKDAGRKVDKHLKENGWELTAIINTHSNADHVGGNRLLKERTGCNIYAKGIEQAITKYPILEPSFLYGGYPCKPLRNKFLMAQPSEALELKELAMPEGMEIIDLEGHFFHMIGIKTPDDIWFLADCMSGKNIIEKYHLSFIYDIREYLKTLDKVEALEGKLFIPSHAEATTDIRILTEINRKKVFEIIEKILCICKESICFEDVLQEVFKGYHLTMDFGQYVLIGSTVKSYLSYLYDEEKIEAEFVDSKLLWKTKK